MNTLAEQLKETTDLDEKLRLIEEAMEKAKVESKKNNVVAPVDPMDNLLCQSCQ